MPTAALIVRMVRTTITSRKPGNSPQKLGPKSRSRPGHASSGAPIQPARRTRSTSYTPSAAPTADPTTIPTTGAQGGASCRP